MIKTIAKHEISYLFRSRLGWVLLAAVQLIFGGCYYMLLNNYIKKQQLLKITEGVSYEVSAILCAVTVYVAILLVPILTMRCITSELRNHSIRLLFNAPISNWSIVLGKYLGVLAYLTIVLLLLFLMMLSAGIATNLDLGILFSALLNTALLLAAYTAVSMWIASRTSQPAIAILLSSGLLLGFLLLQMFANTRIEWLDALLTSLSLIEHYQPALKGLIRLQDLVYFLVLCGVFLSLTTLRIKRLRSGA